MAVAQTGDLVLLLSPEGRKYLIRLQEGGKWFSHGGEIAHDELIGQPLGRTLHTQHGRAVLALEPSTHDLIQKLPRSTQIIFGKDAAQIALRLNLYPGRKVLEAGTGSGGLTLVLARAVMPTGHVYSYELRDEAYEKAKRNLGGFGLLPHVTLHNLSIEDGFQERDADACFLDMRQPWLFLDQVWEALKGSGFFGALLPTTNQVSRLLRGLQDRPFADIVVEEVLVRNYKPVPSRLRPEDRMIAHTGFLIFARKIVAQDESLHWVGEKRRRRYLARQEMAKREAERAGEAWQEEEDPYDDLD